MKKRIQIRLILATFILFFSQLALAHEGSHGTPLKTWEVKGKTEAVKADYVKYDEEAKTVWLRDAHHQLQSISIDLLSENDQKYVLQKQDLINSYNTKAVKSSAPAGVSGKNPSLFLLKGLVLLILILAIRGMMKGSKKSHAVLVVPFALLALLVSCKDDESVDPTDDDPTISANDVTYMKSVFESFSGVTTRTDNTYFYVESNGLPDHNMMVGITNWQQQVPIDHDYSGTNSWAIPLQPEIADNPLSTKTNLLKGAIAIAANGIPIFNPLNNRGEDANAIGELDQWGGHCGRADDYHYHIPPSHLQSVVGADKPIAYAVDGFPIFGPTTEQLDECLGRYVDNGYQYHTISSYPYFMAAVKGKVNLDPNTTAPENQVIPQAMTKGVRPALTPLQGAVITDFKSTGTNAYSLTYTLNNETYNINYSWDQNGKYTYEFVTPSGTTTESYNR